MKKMWLLALVSLFLLLASPVFPASDGMKTLIGDKSGVVIQVPEKAPEFLQWPGAVIGGEKYPNGNGLLLVECINPDETVIVRSLWARIEGKLYILAFAVSYEAHPDRIDLYQDVGFLDTGVPTGMFLQVADSAPLSRFQNRVSGVKI